jgi:hypothetical protein
MPNILLAYSAHKRTLFPEAHTLNCYAEKSPTKPGAPEALIARAGLEEFQEIGTAPYRGVFQQDGLLDDATFVVAETGAYTITAGGVITSLGGVAIAGDDLVEIAGGLDADGNSVIRIANDSALYKYVSGSGGVVEEDFPSSGGAGATSVAYLTGYWLAVEAGTDFIYYIEPAGVAWGQLEFAAAEFGSDKLKGVRAVGEIGWLLGSATTEGWRATGDATSQLEAAGGLKFDFGCRTIAAAVNCAGDLMMVDNNCEVRRSQGGEPVVVSDHGLSEQIRRTSAMDLSASFFQKDGHRFYVLHLGTAATWVYDLTTGRWTRFSSLNLAYWRARLFATMGDTVLAFDRSSEQVWRLDPDRRTDGDDVFTVEFCGFIDVPEGQEDVANIELDCLTGDSPRTGQGSDPLIGLRVSRDGGKTYGTVRHRPMGATGDYTVTPRWNAFGAAKAPHGLICKWEISDPVGRRFSAGRYNVA